ncbi:MAG: HAD family hydrolase [Elusimicrobia bacterium]|nr:HAD family hydrolase [Elusimicrobiota bacterium]
MRVGIDFDNTLVCCAPLFHRVALERGLVPPHLPATKDAVRNYLMDLGRETDWTELQGTVYGPRLCEALPFPGAREFVVLCRQKNIPVGVVSHKTRHALCGPAHNLHDAGYRWLESAGFFDQDVISRDQVFFEPSRAAKLNRIRALGCSHFIDDLREVFSEPRFPVEVKKWLFDPDSSQKGSKDTRSFSTWVQLSGALEEDF